MLNQLASAMGLLVEILAQRAGTGTNDLAVRTLAGAVVGAMMVVMFAVADDPDTDFAEMVDKVMAELETGLGGASGWHDGQRSRSSG